MSYSAIAIIYNPNSTGPSSKLARNLKAQLRTRLPKQTVTLLKTKYAKHAEELVYEFAKSHKKTLIISSSGDGGYCEVVNGAIKAQNEGCDVSTGLLPAGNANDHYHNLHTEDLIERIVEAREMKIDLLKLAGFVGGKAIERYAHSYIGFGLTPKVGRELNKVHLNPLNEAWVVLRTLLTLNSVRLRIDGELKRYTSIIFSNIDVMSKYMKISRPSSVADGKFEVTIFQPRDKFRLLLILLKAVTNGVKEDAQVRKFTLQTFRKTLVQTDGEIITLDPDSDITVTAEKQVLRCII